jgi:hypothetical protein
MKRIAVLIAAALLAACGANDAPVNPPRPDDQPACSTSTHRDAPSLPLFTVNPLGTLSDVTCNWQHYQAADAFCVKLDGIEIAPGGTGVLTDGTDPACAFSGFAPGDTGLYRFAFTVPTLCAGCRRLFIDFSTIPADDPGSFTFYAHGHAYYRIQSGNFTYTIEPTSHSPNTKNFFNDKLVSPPGTPIEAAIGAVDTRDMAYVTDVGHFIHTAIQGAHYIGPWYVNRDGERIHGLYVDVNVGDATSMGSPGLDALFYSTGYDSGQTTCVVNGVPQTTDVDVLYTGCVDRVGGSGDAYDPFGE